MIRIVLAVAAVLLVAAVVVVSLIVEREAAYRRESLGGGGPGRALILYHPSRDAHFSDDLSAALAEGLGEAGLSVERVTMTSRTPAEAGGYAMVVVVSNTYYWTPDLPTLRYLRRARLDGVPAVGVIGGAGATGRSERLLREALTRAGADVLETHSFWLFRPNDEARMNEPNRGVALDLVRSLGARLGRAATPVGAPSSNPRS